jgi:zinc protease
VKLTAAVAAIAILAAPLLAGAQTATVTHLDGVTIASQPDTSAALTGVEFTLAAGLDRQRLTQSGLAALVAQSILETPSSDGESLAHAISARGGSVSFVVEPHDVRFYVEALAADAPAVLALFTRALAAPDFSPATIGAARDALDTKIARDQRQPLQVGLEMLNLARANGANSGLPLFGTPASLIQFAPSEVAAFYHSYYARGGSSISGVGRVDELGSEDLNALATVLPAGSTSAVRTAVHPLEGKGRQLIARRAISAPWLVVGYSAPPVGSADYGPMLVLSAFLQRTLGDIAEVPGTISPSLASQAVGTVYDFNRAPASLFLYVDGAIGDPSESFGTALTLVRFLGERPIEGSIEQFKTIAIGDFEEHASTLQGRAWLVGLFARRTGSADYLNATLRAIEATTPADLERVAHRYLGNPTIALVLPRSND